MLADIYRILPKRIVEALELLPSDLQNYIEEIRLRANQPVEIVASQGEGFITKKGILSFNELEGIKISREECQQFLQRISNHSLYALEEELRRGYITIPGGHRVGMAGKVVLDNGQVAHLTEVTSFNIRIAREKKGVALPLIPFLWDGKRIYNTLIISPPRCGKTTILRDLTRLLSRGVQQYKLPSFKIGLVDERSEIAGCYGGVPQKDVGPKTDVLDGCPKAEGMMMLIRSMSPQILIADEIGRAEDVKAMLEAVHAGVALITTAHGLHMEDIQNRPSFCAILQHKIFDRFIVLSKRNGPGTIEGIFDHRFRSLYGVVHR